eukprot:7244130-Pyramimonas_sp.AAC.1
MSASGDFGFRSRRARCWAFWRGIDLKEWVLFSLRENPLECRESTVVHSPIFFASHPLPPSWVIFRGPLSGQHFAGGWSGGRRRDVFGSLCTLRWASQPNGARPLAT